MKKILAMLLALCALCGGAAMAEQNITSAETAGTTELIYKVEWCDEYTVSIPATETLTPSADGSALVGTLTVSLNAENYTVPNKMIYVQLQTMSGILTHESDPNITLSYTLRSEDDEPLQAGDNVITFRSLSNVVAISNEMTISAALSSTTPAGNYTDTLTFNVRNEDAASTANSANTND